MQPAAPPVDDDREGDRLLTHRLLGAAIGGSLPVLVFPIMASLGLASSFAGRDNTLEGFPFDGLMVAIGSTVGVILGIVFAPRVVLAARVRGVVGWMVGLTLVAPPAGGLVFALLTLAEAGDDLVRWLSGAMLAIASSYFVALPTALAVALIGVPAVRLLARFPVRVCGVAATALCGCALVAGSGAMVGTLGVVGVGPGNARAVAPLTTEPPVPRDHAVAAARPYASELSLTPASFVDVGAYRFEDLCTADTSQFPAFECDYDGVGWFVTFGITAPDGTAATVTVVLDGDTGDLLYTSQ